MSGSTPLHRPVDRGGEPGLGGSADHGDAHRGPGETRSLGEIVGDITTDISTLMREELDLAKTELKQEGTRAAKGAGMFAGAGLAGHFVLVFLSLALMFVLDNVMPIELAALVTALVWALVAGILALVGRKNVKKANPQLPRTQQSLKENAR